MLKLKTILVVLTLILASWPIYKPILDHGFFPVHDDLQIQRIYEMASALKDGQFPVRIIKDFGYGYHYPLFNFYAPLPYYLGAMFNLLGFSFLFAGKAIYFIPNFLSIVFMFILVKKISRSDILAFLAGILYAYFPYRAADNYVRGVTGELFVMMFLPLLILGIYNLFFSGRERSRPFPTFKIDFLLVFSLPGIVLSHNIYAYLVCLGLAIFVVLFFIFRILLSFPRRRESYRSSFQFLSSLVINSFVSLSLTAFFWLPALAENKFTHIEKISQAGYYFGNFFLPLKSLWQSDWGYGGAGGGMTFMIGKVHLVLSFFALIIYIYNSWKTKKVKFLPVLFIFFAAFYGFLTNQRSFFLWELIPLLNLTQYPMRLIFFIDFSLIMFIIFSTKDFFQKANQKIFLFIVLFLSFLIVERNIGFYKSAFNYEFTEKYLSEKYLKWDSTLRGDEYLPKEFALPIKENEIAKESISSDKLVESQILEHKSDEIFSRISNLGDKTTISFPVTFFPGWKMYVNGKEQKIETKTKFNLISGVYPKGNYIVKLKFEDTHVRTVANLISLVSLSCLISLIMFRLSSPRIALPKLKAKEGRRGSRV